MTVYFRDEQVTLLLGDAFDTLRQLPDRSVDCVVSSPPYFGLRDYGVTGQYGLEASPAQYVATMTRVFAEVRRVLADDGTLWLVIGDSYSVRWGSKRGAGRRGLNRDDAARERSGAIPHDIPEKNLLGMPWRVAFSLQDDGWYLRNEIIWAKPNGMPESVRDRLSSRHEQIFLFAKSPRYWFDLDPIREPHSDASLRRSRRNRFATDRSQDGVGSPNTLDPTKACHPAGRNPGDVWSIPTQPFPAAHFAVFPLALPTRCIRAGCRPGGVVLDPFSGAGTTGVAARQLDRPYIGIDLQSAYHDIAVRRFAQGLLTTQEAAR
jgi:DNA modification methylase